MRAFIAIMVREFTDRRTVLGAAAVAAIIPFVLPYFNLVNSPAHDVRGIMAWVMSLSLAWVSAVFLGSSMIGSELGQGRMGFYFSRPVSGLAIWGGKLIASYLLVVICELLVLLPVWLMPSSRAYFDHGPGEPWWGMVALLAGVPLFLLLVTHAVGIMWRARSAWVAIDTGVFLFLILILWISVSPLSFSAPEILFAIGIFLTLSLLVALLAAGAVQVVVGRTDPRRSHAALSITLWSIMFVATVLVGGYTGWVLAIGPEDLLEIETVEAAPSGPWICVSGPSRGRFDFQPWILFNRETSVSLRISSSWPWWFSPVVFSGDGKRVVWVESDGLESWRLVFSDLGEGTPEANETGLYFRAPPGLEVSKSGDRVVILEDGVASVYELETGQLLLAAPLDKDLRVTRVWFMDEDTLRLVQDRRQGSSGLDRTIKIWELDVSKGTVLNTGRIVPSEISTQEEAVVILDSRVVIDPVRDRLLLVRRYRGKVRQITLHDARTGALLADLGVSKDRIIAIFLEDGSLCRVRRTEVEVWLEVCSDEGQLVRTIHLGRTGRVFIGGEVAPGVVTVSVLEDDAGSPVESASAMAVDLNSGEIREIDGATIPALWLRLYSTGLPGNGRLFYTGNQELVEWDPQTGETKRILGLGE
ncbi:MAG: hypothetical protein K8R59_11030 [Thermoanaerobaculales bacterium]|nr:hypothetical protein [Thermoanaerobaculales bacterium]